MKNRGRSDKNLGVGKAGYEAKVSHLFSDGIPLWFMKRSPLAPSRGVLEPVIGVHQSPAGHTAAVAQQRGTSIL